MHAQSFDDKLKNKRFSPPTVESPQELDEGITAEKTKIICICPKCGEQHAMNLVWIGRGTPRKYCQQCRERM